MQFHCAQCHHAWSVEGDSEPEACPNCGAEAGLEAEHGVPPAMRYFGLLLAFVIVTALSGAMYGRFA
jgi:hypothetical protein